MSELDDDDIPPDDAEPTASERAHAKTFGELLDKVLLDRPLPPAMSADDRALLEVATVIRAGSGNMQLAPSAQSSIIEDALRKAIERSATGSPTTTVQDLPIIPKRGAGGGDVTPIASKRRVLPWAIAGVSSAIAAAAVLVLLVRAPKTVTKFAPVARNVPVEWMSRPSDPLIGPIAQDRAGDALSRIDTIFADRLEGYRDRTLGGSR